MTFHKSKPVRLGAFSPTPLAWLLLCFGTAAILFGKGLATPDIVTTASRTEARAIEDVKAGDRIWAYDPSLAKWEVKPVLQPLVHDYDGNIVTVTIAGTNVRATSNHPFWVVRGDNLENRPHMLDPNLHSNGAVGQWVQAGDLQAGDVLVLRNGGLAAINMVTVRSARQKVYNLHIADLHTYAVSDLGVVVHNVSCFPAGALVLMGDGSTKAIDQIEIGDQVLAGDPLSTGPPRPAEVTGLIRDFAAGLVKVSVETSPGVESVLTPTWHHPVWTDNRGWVEAKDLVAGDTLRDSHGRALHVTNVTSESKTLRSYNLSVEDVHTFYALTNDGTPILVHNQTYQIDDGVRRALAAFLLDQPDIVAKIQGGPEVRLPIDSLLSTIKTNIVPDERWDQVFEGMRDYPTVVRPIDVSPGSQGIPIKDVTLGS